MKKAFLNNGMSGECKVDFAHWRLAPAETPADLSKVVMMEHREEVVPQIRGANEVLFLP